MQASTMPISVSTERAKTRSVFLPLALMILFVAGLSFFFFSHQSLRLDEAQSLWQSSRSPGDILMIVAQDVHVPLYHELLHFWRVIVGDSVGSARFLSLIFYLISIPAMYALGRLAYGRTIGLFGALLIALSPFMNWYGNEIRMYTLFTLLIILNQYFYIKLFKEHDRAAWMGYALTAALGIFVHYFFFLNLISQAVFYVMNAKLFPKRTFMRFVFVAGFLAVIFAPWVWYVISQGQAQNQHPLLPIPSAVNLFNTFSQFLVGFQNDQVNTVFLSLWPVTVIFGFLALRRGLRLTPVSQYFLTTIMVSMAIAFALSFVVPLFVSRYLIFTVPSLYLLLASLVESYPQNIARVTRLGLAGLMLLGLAIEIASPTAPVKEDYRAAADYLTRNAKAQDIVILSAPFTVYPIQYYYRGAAPLGTLPLWDQYSYGPIPPFDAAKLPEEVEKLTAEHQTAWLLLSYDQGYQKDVQKYFDTRYQRMYAREVSPGLYLYGYKLRYDTPLSNLGVPPST